LRRNCPDCPCNSSSSWTKSGSFLRADKEPLILLHSGFCTRRLVDKGLQAAGVCANLLIEMNTIQGTRYCPGDRSYGAPSLALRLQEGENLCAVKLTAPTLRRSIGLLLTRRLSTLLLVLSQHASTIGKWIDFSRLEYPSRKMKEEQGLQEELNLG